MDLHYFVVAKYAEQQTGGLATIVGAGFDAIMSNEMPFQHPFFSVAIKIRLNLDEIKVSHTGCVRLMSPEDELVDEMTIDGMTPDRMPQNIPERFSDVNVGMIFTFFGAFFLKEGIYRVEFVFDDAIVMSQPIKVSLKRAREPSTSAEDQESSDTNGHDSSTES